MKGILSVRSKASVIKPALGSENIGIGKIGAGSIDGVLVHGDAGLVTLSFYDLKDRMASTPAI